MAILESEYKNILNNLQEAKDRILPADCEERQLINKNIKLK
jgi:hypothetical protein